ncbi:uncharacterized protein METZ01_LOCUS228039, partial [marine metagenome]
VTRGPDTGHPSNTAPASVAAVPHLHPVKVR